MDRNSIMRNLQQVNAEIATIENQINQLHNHLNQLNQRGLLLADIRHNLHIRLNNTPPEYDLQSIRSFQRQ